MSGRIYYFFYVFKDLVIFKVFFQSCWGDEIMLYLEYKKCNYERFLNLLNAFKENANIPTSYIEQSMHNTNLTCLVMR